MSNEIKSPREVLAQNTAKIAAFAYVCQAALDKDFLAAESHVYVPVKGHEKPVVEAVMQLLCNKGWFCRYTQDKSALDIYMQEHRSNHVPEGPSANDYLTDDEQGLEGGAVDSGRPLKISCDDIKEVIRPAVTVSAAPAVPAPVVPAPAVAEPPAAVVAAPVEPAKSVKPAYTRVDIDRMLGSPRYGGSKPASMPMLASFERLMGTKIEACSGSDETVLQQPGYHSLIAAAKYAFDNHHPLELSPDAIWVSIVQGLAQHVNSDPEKWRKLFVAHEGKAVIRVVRNQFVMGSSTNDWANCFPEFSEQIAKYIGEQSHSLILSDFSTTGPLEQVVSQIALMDVVQAYFDYRTNTMCGIPYVNLTGTADDWKRLQTKVSDLATKFPDLNWWLASLKQVLSEFVNATSGGRVDTEFWKSLYKWDSTSGGDKVNGWLLRLLPFVKDYRDPAKLRKNPLVENYRYGDEEISSNSIPRSVNVVPFIWEYMGSEVNYQFIGGIVGYDQDAETRLVRPKLGWAVRPADAAPIAKAKE